MKNPTLKTALIAGASLLFGLFANAVPVPGDGPGVVNYTPTNKIIQGDQPLVQSYPLSITSPANLVAGTSVTVPLNVTILSKPAAVSDAQALSFLTLASSFTYTGPGQIQSTQVTLDVPLGNVAGSYAYLIKASGWPSGLTIEDNGTTVNALVIPADSTDNSPPSVVLNTPLDGTVYTYYPVTGQPVAVPITFDGSVGPNGQPITVMNAFVNNNPVSSTVTGIGTHAASGSASLQLTTPGTYVIRATATNLNGTSEDSADISVVLSAPPPSITVASPSVNAAYTYPVGNAGASVSVSYTATSLYGNITATGATLDGAPITLSLTGVNTSLTAVGTANLTVAAGSHVLAFTASNEYGAAVPVSVPFKVKEIDTAPIIPTVSILTPVDGSVFARIAGDAATVVNFTYEGGTTGGAIESVTVMIDGTTVSSTVNGLNTAAITGSGSASYSAAGTHTLTVTVSNGQATATDTTSYTVNENPKELCAILSWLPPISLNKTVKGGSKVPVKFTLTCDDDFVREESILISIYEVYDDNSISEPVIYPYGTGSPNAPDYAITGNKYHLNFKTAKGVHHYRIEVIYPLNEDGTSSQTIDTKDLYTTKKGKSCKSEKSGKSDKSGKSCKSEKSGKSEKSDKSCKSDKSDKSGKSVKSNKSDKSGKDWGKSDKSSKNDKSNKNDKSKKKDKSSKSSSKSSSWGWGSSGWGSSSWWCWW